MDSIKTALELKRAIEFAPSTLRPIGSCESMVNSWINRYSYAISLTNMPKKLKDIRAGVKRLSEMCKAFKQSGHGLLTRPFELTITREGCAYTGTVTPAIVAKGTDQNALETLLKGWFEHATVSGFGDVQAQETRFDESVRSAREILPTEFSVSSGLLEEIKERWAADEFFPSHPDSIRIEPYKIHLYGPDGCFRAHKDTPESGLVGTFLVGLGDTARFGTEQNNSEEGALWIGERLQCFRHKAHRGTWAAFFPDVAHGVSDIISGYRAVIAFKIFSSSGETPLFRPGVPQSIPVGFETKVEEIRAILSDIPLPFGLHLAHQYCFGTQTFNGFDSLVAIAAQQIPKVSVHFLPVVLSFSGKAQVYDGAKPPTRRDVTAYVYPFTPAHIAAVVGLIRESEDDEPPLDGLPSNEYEDSEVDENYDDYPREPSSTRVLLPNAPSERLVPKSEAVEPWLRDLRNIPFYTIKIMELTGSQVKMEKVEGAEYTGNEARPAKIDSLYLSYAMVLLHKEA